MAAYTPITKRLHGFQSNWVLEFLHGKHPALMRLLEESGIPFFVM